MTLVSECDRTIGEALRGRRLTKKGIVIQYMRGIGYDGTAMDDTGSKELVDLKKENAFLSYFRFV